MSRRMFGLVCVITCLLAAVVTAPAARAAVLDNPFAGSWAGTFINLTNGAGGVLEWTIDDNGRLRGSYLWDNGDSGKFVGHVKPDGRINVAAPGGGGGYAGLAYIDFNGDMIVDAVDRDSGSEYFVVLSSS